MANKEVQELLRKLRKAGWTVEQTKGSHYRVTPPEGGRFEIVPGTPSDSHSLANTVAALRRRGFVWKGR